MLNSMCYIYHSFDAFFTLYSVTDFALFDQWHNVSLEDKFYRMYMTLKNFH